MKSDEFAPECKRMDSCFIHADSWEKIESAILRSKETKMEVSEMDEDGILPLNMGSIGADIINHLKKQTQNKSNRILRSEN